MLLNVTSTEYVNVPVSGPAGVDLTVFAVSLAIVPEAQGEPLVGDWQAASWTASQEARILVTAGSLPAGAYMAWVKVTATPEVPVMQAGRVRVGDARL